VAIASGVQFIHNQIAELYNLYHLARTALGLTASNQNIIAGCAQRSRRIVTPLGQA